MGVLALALLGPRRASCRAVTAFLRLGPVLLWSCPTRTQIKYRAINRQCASVKTSTCFCFRASTVLLSGSSFVADPVAPGGRAHPRRHTLLSRVVLCMYCVLPGRRMVARLPLVIDICRMRREINSMRLRLFWHLPCFLECTEVSWCVLALCQNTLSKPFTKMASRKKRQSENKG